MTGFARGTRVYLPFRPASGEHNAGTVTRSEPGCFRVTWDDPKRLPGQPRLRTWHGVSEISRFRLGTPGPDAE